MAHVTRIKVRGYHLDGYGHVNNARYLEFLEEGRWGIMDDSDTIHALEDLGQAFVVVQINIRFRKPICMGDRIEVHTRLDKLGVSSGEMEQVIRPEGSDVLMSDAKVMFVIVDKQTHRPVAIDGRLREVLDRVRRR
jgi:thioesterase-3